MGSTCPEHTIQQRASAGIKEVGKDNSNTPQQKQQQPGGESKLMKNLRNQHIQATKQTSQDLVPKYKIGELRVILEAELVSNWNVHILTGHQANFTRTSAKIQNRWEVDLVSVRGYK